MLRDDVVPILCVDDDQFMESEEAVMMARCVYVTDIHAYTLQLLGFGRLTFMCVSCTCTQLKSA